MTTGAIVISNPRPVQWYQHWQASLTLPPPVSYTLMGQACL
jgi:hypothetical protein